MERPPAENTSKGAAAPSRINRLLFAQAKRDYAALTNLVMIRNYGLNGEDAVSVRAELREKGLKMRIVRSRVTMRAFREMGVAEAEKLFAGPTMIVEGPDPVATAKLAVELCKKFLKGKERKVEIIGGLLDGQLLNVKDIEEFAKIPSREELLARISGQVYGVGAQVAACALGPARRLAGAVKTLADKQEEDSSGDSAADAQAA